MSSESLKFEPLIAIIKQVRSRITETSDMIWTSYGTPAELVSELNTCILQLEKGDPTSLEILNLHFGPASTFQDHSIQNGWSADYHQLASDFDKVYAQLKLG